MAYKTFLFMGIKGISITLLTAIILSTIVVAIPVLHEHSGNLEGTIAKFAVAVTNVASSKTVVGQGFSANISVTVANQGGYSETFNVTAFVSATIVGSENVTLPAGNSTTLTFTWNTTGFAYSNYTLSAYAWPVSGETYTANNNFTGGMVTITISGDINGDGTVNILDAITLANAFLATPGSRNWNPNADINGDGVVNILDAIILANHFLQHYP